MAGGVSFNIGANEQEAVRSVRKLAKEADDSFDDMARSADKAGKKISSEISGGFKEAGKEAGQSGREGAASFAGGFDDVADFVQETLANALSGFGPAGAAAGIALAAVVGTVLSNAAAAQEALATSRERAVDLAGQLYENGGTLPLTDRVQELFTLLGAEQTAVNPLEKLGDDYFDLGTNIDLVRAAAKSAKTPVENLLSALTGADISDTRKQLELVNAALYDLNQDTTTPLADLAARRDDLVGMRTELEKVVGASELANDLYSSTEFMNTKRVDDLAAAWDNASVKIGDYFAAGEDGALTFDAAGYIASYETAIAQAAELKAELVTLPDSIKEEAERRWAEGGVGMADAFVDSYQAADADTKAKLEAIAGPQGQAAGKAASAGFVAEADAGVNAWNPRHQKVVIDVDDSAVKRWEAPPKYGTVQYNVSGRPYFDTTP